MKLIIAYIKPLKLSETILALHKVEGLTGMTVLECKGYGRGGSKPLAEGLVDYVPHVKLEVACVERRVEEVISTIQKSAHTGLRGDGKIYILNVETAVRISTGERGEMAI
ncbi:MAG: P-II family nitrogen regulator [bacterium]|nr:P-II family nitrogen regulator [bacterium]